MDFIPVKLMTPNGQKAEMVLNSSEPVRKLIKEIRSALQLPRTNTSGSKLVYELRKGPEQSTIKRNESLAFVGIQPSDCLTIWCRSTILGALFKRRMIWWMALASIGLVILILMTFAHGCSTQVRNRPSEHAAAESKQTSFNNYRDFSRQYKQAYDTALANFKNYDYQTALDEFCMLREKDNLNTLADNTQYWIGECYHGMKRYDDAICEFDKVRLYRDNNKINDSLTMIRRCRRLGNAIRS